MVFKDGNVRSTDIKLSQQVKLQCMHYRHVPCRHCSAMNNLLKLSLTDTVTVEDDAFRLGFTICSVVCHQHILDHSVQVCYDLLQMEQYLESQLLLKWERKS